MAFFIESTRFSRWIFPMNFRLSTIIIGQHLQLLNQVWWIHHFFYNASNYFENVIILIVIYWRKWTKTKNSEFITKTKMLEFSGKNWVVFWICQVNWIQNCSCGKQIFWCDYSELLFNKNIDNKQKIVLILSCKIISCSFWFWKVFRSCQCLTATCSLA